MDDNTLSFRLKGVFTTLDNYIEYQNIHSWVRLFKDKNAMDVFMGIPSDFPSPQVLYLRNPDRLVVRFYPANNAAKVSKVTIRPLRLSETFSDEKMGHDRPIGQAGADSSEESMPHADESAPTNDNKKDAPLETGRDDDHGPFFRGKIIEDSDHKQGVENEDRPEMTAAEFPLGAQVSGSAKNPSPVIDENGGGRQGTAGGKGAGFMALGPPLAQGSNYQIRITPKVSIQEEYDDNIFLTGENPDSDWITTISPGFEIDVESGKNGLELDYTFGWVKYLHSTSNDNIRHSGRLKFWQKLAEHLKFNLEDRYLKSDDIFDEDLSPILPSQRVAKNRSRYQRNDASASLEYDFGPRSKFIAGYLYNILDNDDPNQEDVTEKGPFAGVSHWFDNKNSVDFTYRFAEYDYTQKGVSEARPNIEVQDIGFVYSHRFSERVKPYLTYRFYQQNFMGVEESYWIHNFGAGLGYAFSQKTSFDIYLGGFYPAGKTTATPGMTAKALLKRDFERGSISLGADTGWDTGFTEVIPRGFTRYYGGLGRIDYQLSENLDAYAGADYRQNRYQDDDLDIIGGDDPADDRTLTGRFGLNYRFYRWFSLDVSYTYRQRFSDDPTYEFVDNRFLVKFNAAKPFRW